MPIVRLTLQEGYEDALRVRLAERLTDAVRATIAAPLEAITIVIDEVKPSSYMRGRAARRPGAALASPSDTVRAFLVAMEARDLAGARSLLAPSFRMTFPGGAEFTALEELVAWGGKRYRFVRKTYEGFDECFGEQAMVVYCFGTLSGEWPDGRPFEGVRFIDRFTVDEGKLVDQRVWNDLDAVAARQNATAG
ncbi:nuclear transport factor 2 family protein [Arvimicrobium flavum]|uniref:nuclear transport factor 2 family protein n=1 Tax=Arvimicrobium flavum TaxID=3393320 RepID=UPI00237B6195|nr:nuclear transport factor 2 family protein [Mesorhizobium shangrilense]